MTVPYWLSYDFSPVTWILMAVAVVAACWAVIVPLRRMSAILGRVRHDAETLAEDATDESIAYPPVSVIVYACCNSDVLPALAESLLGQDYPAPFEVIVVNDGSDPHTHDAIQRLMLTHTNLYLTFVPDHSRSLSRRKLSITLGIKAAEYDTVVLTRGNCLIESPLWLKAMMRHAARGSEVVVGLARLDCPADAPAPRHLRTNFDEAWQMLTYLPRAISGRPYRASGCNLAYSRHLFFDHKGFSRSLHIKGGDDDMFVADIARGVPCDVELSPEATVRIMESAPRQAYRALKKERLFADKVLPKRPRLLMGSVSLAWWTWLLASAASIAVALPSAIPAAVMLISGIALCGFSIASWRRFTMTLCSQKVVWSVPFLSLWHPFFTVGYKLRGYRHRKENYTWN